MGLQEMVCDGRCGERHIVSESSFQTDRDRCMAGASEYGALTLIGCFLEEGMAEDVCLGEPSIRQLDNIMAADQLAPAREDIARRFETSLVQC